MIQWNSNFLTPNFDITFPTSNSKKRKKKLKENNRCLKYVSKFFTIYLCYQILIDFSNTSIFCGALTITDQNGDKPCSNSEGAKM